MGCAVSTGFLMSILTQVRQGIAWTTGARVSAQILDFSLGIVLARLLTPEDFGLLEMTVVITGFLALFGELGFGAALVQREVVTDAHASTVFWLNVLTGVALGALLALGAPWIAQFYDEPRLVPLTWALAVNFLITPLNMVQGAMLNREMKFKLLAILEVSSIGVSSTTGLVLALNDMGTWSLVGRSFAGSLTTTALIWTLSTWRPRWIFSRAALKDLVAFSGNLLGFMTINYWARQADDLLIGKYMGPAQLGIYGRAYSTMMLPMREISNVLGRVLFPTLSRISQDKPRVRQLYLECMGLIAFLAFPIMALICATADNLVVTLYGRQWERVAPVLRIFCAVGAFQSLGTTVGWIYQSQGRTDWMLRWGVVASALMIGSFGVGIYIGSIEAVAICYAIVTVVILSYPQFAVPGRLIGMTSLDVFRAVWQVGVCALLSSLAVWLLGKHLLSGVSAGLVLGVQFPVGILLYLALTRVLAPSHLTRVREFLFARQRAAAAADGAQAEPQRD